MSEERGEQPIEETLARAAGGDGAAWRAVVDQYAKRVYAVVVGQCGDRELAEEITQATFVKLVEHIGRYAERGKFEPWLFRIAMNQLRDEMRRRKRQARSMDMSGGGDDGAGGGEEIAWAAVEGRIVGRESGGTSGTSGGGGDGEDPAERVSRAEQVELLRAAVMKLSPGDQEILSLRHTAGLSFAQIAETLEEPLGTVLARGHRALAKLKKMMEEETVE